MKNIIYLILLSVSIYAGIVEDTTVGTMGYQRQDSQIEAVNGGGVGHALIAITNIKSPGDITEEGAISYGAYDSNGDMKQVSSISAMWSNNATPYNGIGVLRFNVDTVSGGSDIAMRIFANNGVSFYGGSDSVSPGGKFISITRSSGFPSISGMSDIVIDGSRSTAGSVFLNAYNSGDVNLNLGGGNTIFNGYIKLNNNVVSCPTSTTATRCIKIIDIDNAYSYIPLFR